MSLRVRSVRSSKLRLAGVGLCAASALCALASPAGAQSSSRTDDDKEHSAEAPSRPADMPLSLLPDPPPLELPPPRPASLEAIDGILARLTSDEPTARETARRELLEAKPDWVAGLARRIDQIAERSDKTALRALLERARSQSKRTAGDEEDAGGGDYLDLLLARPEPASAHWKNLTQTLAVSRMLRQLGSPEAVRELIRIYVRFGEFLRIDTQKQLEALGDRQIAGLIEAQRHPAPKIASWAKKRLDLLGKAIPHEAVRTEDPAALAAILVALGRTRDPDAARVLISFASTERAQIRTAARQGLALLGEVAAWRLRDAYLDTTGKAPPRDWTWKRTARELFTEYDRLRSAKVFEVFAEAQAAEKAGELDKMRDGYDRVLALSPLFEQRERMSKGYRAYAEAQAEEHPELAISALRRVERVSDDAAERRRAESLRYALEARLLAERDVLDRGLLDKAIALDPDNPWAEKELERSATARVALSNQARYLLAGTIALVSLGGAGWIGWAAWRRRNRTSDDAGEAELSGEGDELDEAATPSNDALEEPDGTASSSDASGAAGDEPAAPSDARGELDASHDAHSLAGSAFLETPLHGEAITELRGDGADGDEPLQRDDASGTDTLEGDGAHDDASAANPRAPSDDADGASDPEPPEGDASTPKK